LSPALADLQLRCLARRSVELRVVADALAEADATVVERSAHLVSELSAIAGCDDLDALARRANEASGSADPAADELLEEMLRVDVLGRAGKSAELLPQVEALIARARAAGNAAIEAEALLNRA